MRYFGKSVFDALSSTLSGKLQRRLVEYALKRLLGAYIRKDLSTEDIELQLRNGRLSFTNLDLRTEVINDKLAGCGFYLLSGEIGMLEIYVPWTDLLLGKIKIVLHRPCIVLQSTSAHHEWSESLHVVEQNISDSIAEISDSFLAESSVHESGVSDEMPEPAMLQRMIDVLLANLSVELLEVSVELRNPSQYTIVLDSTSFIYAPGNTAASKEISSQGLSISIEPQLTNDREPSDWHEPVNRPSSSQSTSSSSYDDADLMQSTIFDAEQGRSLFMSAMSSLGGHSPSSLAESVAAEGTKSERMDSRRCLITTSAFHGLVLSKSDMHMQLDLSLSQLEIRAGRQELLALARVMHTLVASKPRVHDISNDSSSDHFILESQIRVASTVCELDLLNSHSFTDVDSANVLSSIFTLSIQRLHLDHSPVQGLDLEFAEIAAECKGGTIRCPSSNKPCKLVIDESKGSTLDLDRITIDLALNDLSDFKLSLMDLINSVYSFVSPNELPHQTDSSAKASEITRPQYITISSSEIHLRSTIADLGLSLTCQKPVVQCSTNSRRSRVSLSFEQILFELCLEEILRISSSEQLNVIDFTIAHTKPVQPMLEFINYSEIFEHSERDLKAEANTLKALKQKSKEVSDYTLRASIGKVLTKLDIKKVRLCHTLADLLRPQDLSSSTEPDTKDDSIPRQIYTILVEIAQINLELESPELVLKIDLGRGSCFAVQNLKSIAAVSVELSRLEVAIEPNAANRFRLVHRGLHLDSSSSSDKPAFSVRARHNLSGKRRGEIMVRVGVTDSQIEYQPDMTWIHELLALGGHLSSTAAAEVRAAEVVEGRAMKFAIDFTNTSIGLNPYSGKSKGMLYLRRSTFYGCKPHFPSSWQVTIHAGVVELFLTDNIDDGQGDRELSQKRRHDVLNWSLSRLGFVKVISAETVEMSLGIEKTIDQQLEFSIEIVKAIITISTCADSTATLSTLFTLLRLPVVLSDELKYKLGLTDDGQVPIDVFAEIEEDAFRRAKTFVTQQNSGSEAAEHAIDRIVMIPAQNNDAPGIDEDVTSTNLAGKGLVVEKSVSPIDDEYFKVSSMSEEIRDARGRSKLKLISVDAKNCFLVWNLHDGYDWPSTRHQISCAIDRAIGKLQVNKENHESKVNDNARRRGHEQDEDEDEDDMEASTEVGDLLFNSIYIALPNDAKADEVKRSISEALAQADVSDTATQTTVTESPGTLQHKIADPECLQLGRSLMHKVRIDVSDIDAHFELFDAREGEVQTISKIRLHEIEIVDNVSTSTWKKFLTYNRGAGLRDSSTSMAELTMTGIKPIAGLAAAELSIAATIAPLRLHVDQDTLEFLSRFFEFKDDNTSLPNVPADELFIQRFEIQAIPIQIDYKPKRVDLKSLRSGRTTELKNLFILEDSSMILKHVILYGVCGIAKVFEQLNDIWLAHIKSKQLSTVLAGVSPIRSLASFGSGVRNLVSTPISEYRRDGRIVPGLKKGIGAFVKSTGTEAIRLGAKLAVGTQGLLENAEHSLGRTGERNAQSRSGHAVSMYANQPKNIQQGLSQGVGGMSKHVKLAKEALVSLPGDLEEETDARGIVRIAAKTVPVAVLRPLIGTTEMISKTLLGLRNTMNPEQRKLNDDKYKHRE